jgi:hypothetical protein
MMDDVGSVRAFWLTHRPCVNTQTKHTGRWKLAILRVASNPGFNVGASTQEAITDSIGLTAQNRMASLQDYVLNS